MSRGAKARVVCVCVRERERETVVGKGSGSRSCVCVSVRERERGDGSRGCLIGKQMNNVSFITKMKTERRPQQTLCVQERVILVA